MHSEQPSRRGRPPRTDGGETRRRILDAALDLFAANGFRATTTRDIAARAGLSDAGLYAHFSSKQDVFDALFRTAGPNVVTSALGAAADIPRDRGPEAFIRALVDATLARWSEPRARKFMGVAIRDGTLETKHGAPSLADGIAEAVSQVATAFKPWVEEGLLRTDFPPQHLAWELFAPLINLRLAFLHANASAGDLSRAKSLARRHVEYFLSNVLVEPPANRRTLRKVPPKR